MASNTSPLLFKHRLRPPSCVQNMSGQVHAGRLRLPKVWHAVSFVIVQKVPLFALESLRCRTDRNGKTKSQSWTCLTHFIALKNFSSYKYTCGETND